MKLDTQWIVGFVDGEGCFHVSINPHKDMKTGYQILPEFTVVQHERDIKVLYALKQYFSCGVVRVNRKDETSTKMAYRVRDKTHLLNKIVPFFMAHPLKTQKQIDFMKFRYVLLMMEKGDHLKESGIEEIRTVINQMNTRKILKIKSDLSGNS